ncbi:MAG: ABC transporter permease [Clostridiales bacterium]|jgi:ABC-2 type transport system permease protein|nr:ABC transporter permease [Clostridiales bacterium]MDR2750756.1 ABC transporter permease [Clostridiales bacterium]
MKTILGKEFGRTWIGLMIWSAIIALVAFFGVSEYPVFGQNIKQLEDALALIPKIGQLICGVYNVNFAELTGYYVVMYYWIGLIVFTHAIYTGASIIAKESRDKTVEYLFTKPYTRSEIVWAKILAGLLNILAVGAITLAMSLLAILPISNDPVVYMQVFVSCIGMLFTQCVLMSLGFLCSAFFKSYKSGVMGAAAVLIGSYCLMFFVQYLDMPALNFLSPLTYFSVSFVVADGLGALYVLLAISVISICFYFTQKLYAKKVMVS